MGIFSRLTARDTIWLALVSTALGSLGVLWGLSWGGAEDAVVDALSAHLGVESALLAAQLEETPVELLVDLGQGHAMQAAQDELQRLTDVSELHDLALIGPEGHVIGSDGSWLAQRADASFIEQARAQVAATGDLYRDPEGHPYLTAYAPLPGHLGWVVAVEGSASLDAINALAARQAVASALVLAMVLGLGWLLAHRITLPLRRLTATLQDVEPGDPPDTVQLTGTREVVALGLAARRLLAAIQARDDVVASTHAQEIEQLTRVAAEIAHEIRNPLNAMALSTTRLVSCSGVERRQQLRHRLEAQIAEIEGIVGRLLVLTRPITPACEWVDPHALVLSAGEGVAVDVCYRGPHKPCLWADPALLTEVVRNILLNAAQAGASTVTASLIADTTTQWTFEDNGPGVQHPEDVFAWFHTTRAQGSGLGLPISRRMAEAMDGSLTLSRAHPATFDLTLLGRVA